MILQVAKQILMNERMDWKRPHLRWFPNTVYTVVARTRRV